MYEKVCVIVTVLLFLAVFIWGQVELHPEVVNDVNDICRTVVSAGLTIVTYLSLLIYEVMSFMLYYKPLREYDTILQKNFLPLLAGKAESDCSDGKEEVRAFEPFHHSSTYMFKASFCSLNLMRRYHKMVRRNFWAGVGSLCAGLAINALYVLFSISEDISQAFGISSATSSWYWNSGVGEALNQGLIVTIYVCMMLSEKYWRRAFTPIYFWQRKVWNL